MVETILEATALVLQERGYAGTTTNHIAKKAGIGISSFYAYFPDKDAAIAAVVERFLDRAVEVMVKEGTSVLSYPPDEALRIALHRLVEVAASQAPLIRVLYQEVPYIWDLPPVRKLVSRLMELGRTYTPIQNFVPESVVTEGRLFLVISMIGTLIGLLATSKKVEGVREELIDEVVILAKYGFSGLAKAQAKK